MRLIKSAIIANALLLFSGNFVIVQAQVDRNAEVQVFDFYDAEELQQYESLNLDASHKNLLDPSASEEDIEEVISSWTQFHQLLNNYMSEEGFRWEPKDATKDLRIVHKMYFHPSGEMKQYFFRVLNSEIEDSTRDKYASLVEKFAAEHKIDFSMDKPFAQCGKTKTILK